MGRTKKLLCAVAVCATAVVGVGASAAYAGEVTGPSGSGKPTGAEFHANSICVFSGLNDDPTAPLTLDLEIAPNGPGGVVAVVRAGRQAGSAPPRCSTQPAPARATRPGPEFCPAPRSPGG
jgi:hypothetical protein